MGQARTQGGFEGFDRTPLFTKILINAHTVNFDFDAGSRIVMAKRNWSESAEVFQACSWRQAGIITSCFNWQCWQE